MNTYSPNDVLRIAKRRHNTKRTYLLVDPLQAKHMPVSPGRALDMMRALGVKLARAYPACRLVIGFAETATAIGAAAASCFPEDCVYIHTTRETVSDVSRWVLFLEEHSHAAEQKLCGQSLGAWIENTEQIIFVDDEISTGKTLLNMTEQLREQFPALRTKQLAAASVINRLSRENEDRLSRAGIAAECLVRLAEEDYTEQVRAIQISPPVDLMGAALPEGGFTEIRLDGLPDPRKGVEIGRYRAGCLRMADSVIPLLKDGVAPGGRVLVLGTEECMYPGLVLGRRLEQELGVAVYCHATTRSPIGISSQEDYPIRTGYKLHSFYDAGRETYIYDLARYDAAIIVSDAGGELETPLRELGRALKDLGCGRLFAVHWTPLP